MAEVQGWKSLKGWSVDHYFNRGSPTALCGMVGGEEEDGAHRDRCTTCEYRFKHRSGSVGPNRVVKPRGP